VDDRELVDRLLARGDELGFGTPSVLGDPTVVRASE
jgi:hypothetical protein